MAGHLQRVAVPLAGLPGVRAGREGRGSPQQDKSGFFASPLAPAFAAAAPEVWTGWSQTPWDVFGIWASTVTPNLVSGQTVSSQLAGSGAAISNYAQSAGYQVVTK